MSNKDKRRIFLDKSIKYEEFGQRLIEFFYSPNRMTVVY